MSAEENGITTAEPRNETLATDHILVALDASPHSAAALVAAAEVAAALNLELRGLYVEDVNLLHLCGLPFGLEIGSFTANPRRLEQARMERDFRIQASLLRKIMADVAGRQRVSWSFKVVRGGVTQELLSAGSTAQMVSLGRVGTTPGRARRWRSSAPSPSPTWAIPLPTMPWSLPSSSPKRATPGST
jgi:hypothetical protein